MSMVGVLLSAVIAGVAAILVTVAIERWGGLVGGVVGTVPSTIVPAAFGMWFAASSQEEFFQAMGIVPIGLILNATFLYLWRVVPPFVPGTRFTVRLTSITIITLSAWAFLAAASITGFGILVKRGVEPLTIGWVALACGIILATMACLREVPTPRGHNPVGPTTLLARGVAASASIGVAVWLASVGNPLASGIMSIFPAIFTTSMVALWVSQGEAVPTGAIGPMMLGSQSVSLYALLVALAYPLLPSGLGLVFASIIAWIFAVVFINLPAWKFLESRASLS